MTEETDFYIDNSVIKNCEYVSMEEVSNLKKQIMSLTNENEECKQEIYNLRRKLESEEKFYTEAIECQEHSTNQLLNELKQEMKEMTKKFNDDKEHFTQQIVELENDIFKKTNEMKALKETLKQSQSEHIKIVQSQLNISTPVENDTKCQTELKEIKLLLKEETDKNDQLKENYNLLCNEIKSLQEILNDTKNLLKEKDQVIESLKEELAICQSELNTLKSSSTNVSSKGNSIFAELEDSRQKMSEKMKVMQNSLITMKRAYNTKESEIEKIKLEKEAMMRTWEEDSMKIMAQSREVENTYKDTIFMFQKQLKEERARCETLRNNQLENSNISFLKIHTLELEKDISKLRSQIEDDYVQKCIDQEKMEKVLKELKLWKYKALVNKNDHDSIKSSDTSIGVPGLLESADNEKENLPLNKKSQNLLLMNEACMNHASSVASYNKSFSNVTSAECSIEETMCVQTTQVEPVAKKVTFNVTMDKEEEKDSQNEKNQKQYNHKIEIQKRRQKTYPTVFISSNSIK